MFLCSVKIISGLDNECKFQMSYVDLSVIMLYAFGNVMFLIFFLTRERFFTFH